MSEKVIPDAVGMSADEVTSILKALAQTPDKALEYLNALKRKQGVMVR